MEGGGVHILPATPLYDIGVSIYNILTAGLMFINRAEAGPGGGSLQKVGHGATIHTWP